MIIRMLGFGILGFVGYKLLRRGKRDTKAAYAAAYAADQPHESYMQVRDAGPQAMRDSPEGEWTETDEDLDESYPASDPPGGY